MRGRLVPCLARAMTVKWPYRLLQLTGPPATGAACSWAPELLAHQVPPIGPRQRLRLGGAPVLSPQQAPQWTAQEFFLGALENVDIFFETISDLISPPD